MTAFNLEQGCTNMPLSQTIIDEFVDDNWDFYKEWLAEYMGYGYALDWDSEETRLEFYLEHRKK